MSENTDLSKNNDDQDLHQFVLTTFPRFTYCYYCGKFIYGLILQGYSCQGFPFQSY